VDIALVKIAGTVFISLLFVVTVLLMPWIFGVNSPPRAAAKRDDVPTPAPAAVAGPPVSMPEPSERLVKS